MYNIDIANGLIFKEMGIDKGSIEQTLINQKKIYLIQEMGVELGYVYIWYTRGPYSSELSTYMHTNIDLFNENNFEGNDLTDMAKEKIKKVNLFSKDMPNELTEASWYELLSSVLYIKNNWKHVDNDDVYNKLIVFNPKYNRSQFIKAIEILQKEQLISN